MKNFWLKIKQTSFFYIKNLLYLPIMIFFDRLSHFNRINEFTT